MQFGWLTSRWFVSLIVQPISLKLDLIKREIIDTIRALPGGDVIDKRSKTLSCIYIHIADTQLTLRGVITAMKCTDTQEFDFEFGKPIDKKGAPASVQDGSVVLSVSDGNGTIVPNPTNPFAGTFKASKPTTDITKPGTVVIQADADLGDGVTNIVGAFPVEVSGGAAVGFAEPTFGAVREQA